MYERITTTSTALKNGLIALSDQTFAGVNLAFDNATKSTEGHLKWVDFFIHYWHRDCVCKLILEAFVESYRGWCKRKSTDLEKNSPKNLRVGKEISFDTS